MNFIEKELDKDLLLAVTQAKAGDLLKENTKLQTALILSQQENKLLKNKLETQEEGTENDEN